MKLLQELNEATEQAETRKSIMKQLRASVPIDQWGGSYSEPMSDHQRIKMHGTRETDKAIAAIKKFIEEKEFEGITVEKTSNPNYHGGKTDGIVIRFKKDVYGTTGGKPKKKKIVRNATWYKNQAERK